MKKSDLKSGMRVTLRRGVKGIVLLGTSRGDIIPFDRDWETKFVYH